MAVREDETINAAALTTMFRQIIANNRAGGWRKLKRDAEPGTGGERSALGCVDHAAPHGQRQREVQRGRSAGGRPHAHPVTAQETRGVAGG